MNQTNLPIQFHGHKETRPKILGRILDLLGLNTLVEKGGWLITIEWVITVDNNGITSTGDTLDSWYIPWKNIDSISFELKNDHIDLIIINIREHSLSTTIGKKAYIKIEKHRNLLTIYNTIEDRLERYKIEVEQEKQRKLVKQKLASEKAEQERPKRLAAERLVIERAEWERQKKLTEEKRAEEAYFLRLINLQDIQKIPPIEFEELISKLFQKMGFSVITTSITRDEGVDLVLNKDEKTSIVQCKRFAGSVGQPIVRDLYGTMVHNRAYDAYLITTGTFSLPAKSWASGKPIHLVDGSMLVEWIESHL